MFPPPPCPTCQYKLEHFSKIAQNQQGFIADKLIPLRRQQGDFFCLYTRLAQISPCQILFTVYIFVSPVLYGKLLGKFGGYCNTDDFLCGVKNFNTSKAYSVKVDLKPIHLQNESITGHAVFEHFLSCLRNTK